MFKLRNYQASRVEEIRGMFETGARAVCLAAPCGSGKTVMFSYISHHAARHGTRTCILVHRDTLLKQASQALTECGVPHGIIAPGHTPTTDLIHIASVQTLVRRLDRHNFDLLVIDECHHAIAGSWRKIISAMPGAAVLGVTATPCRTDGQGLDDIFQYLVLGPSTAELIEREFLVPPVVYAPAARLDLSRLHIRAGDYDKRELADTMDRPTITGSAVAHYQKICPGVPAVAFCVSIQHAEDVAADFNDSKVPAAAISGRMRSDAIHARLDDLRNGRLRVITSCDLIGEGLDIPGITAAILLRPTQSMGLYIQQVGRALRPAPGKTKAIVLDHSGNCFRHGMPDDDREWTLEGRKRNHRTGESAPPVKQCPKCYACHRPAPVCPQCRYIYAIEPRGVEKVDGELAEIKMERRDRIRKARTLTDLHRLAREFGYRPGWAFIQWNRLREKSVKGG